MDEKDLKAKLPDEPTFEERKKAELDKLDKSKPGLRDLLEFVQDLEEYHKDD